MVVTVAPTRASSFGTSRCKERQISWQSLWKVSFLVPRRSFVLHMSPPRTILLVGEGNFSFSASLCQHLSTSATSITATCLQSEDEALRHQGAADNIHIINKSGKNFGGVEHVCRCIVSQGETVFLLVLLRWISAVRGGLQKAGRLCLSPGSCVWPCGVQLSPLREEEWR